jgi:hypothetical protein
MVAISSSETSVNFYETTQSTSDDGGIKDLWNVGQFLRDYMAHTLMMEAVNTSEMSVNLYETSWRNIPEGSHLHSRRRENLNFTEIKVIWERSAEEKIWI